MQVFEMVVAIVVVSCIAGVTNNFIKMRKSGQNSHLDPETLDRIHLLEERVQVLERVITDDREHLKRQIDGLGGD